MSVCCIYVTNLPKRIYGPSKNVFQPPKLFDTPTGCYIITDFNLLEMGVSKY